MPIVFRVLVRPDPAGIAARAGQHGVLDAQAHGALRQSLEGLMRSLVAETPRGHGEQTNDSRRLASSWYLVDTGIAFRIGNDKRASNGRPVIRYLLKGNDPGGGWISPRKASVLRFTVDGEAIFARRVRAFAGNDFFTPLVTRWKAEARGLLKDQAVAYARWLVHGR